MSRRYQPVCSDCSWIGARHPLRHTAAVELRHHRCLLDLDHLTAAVAVVECALSVKVAVEHCYDPAPAIDFLRQRLTVLERLA